MNKSLCTLRPLLFGLSIVFGATPLFAQIGLLDSIQVMGGSGFDNVVSITPDHSGNLFVLGTTQSSDFPATASFGNRPANSSNSSGDTFVAKIRLADWSLTWSAVIRPSVPLALAIDESGAVYLTCWSDSPANFPAIPGAFRTTASGPWGPLFVLKLDQTGSRIVYSAFLAPYQLYTSAPIAVDMQGQVYVAAEGSGPITTGAVFPAVTVGSPGAYLAKVSADGSKVIFSTYLASSATVAPKAVAVDDQQSVFVAGSASAYNSAFPSTPGVIQPKHGGGDDAFVMKFRADGGKIEFATLLGGAGGDSANFLWLGSDGSTYVAGYCDYGTSSSADDPFPTTPNAPFRTFGLFQGFVARLSPDASSLLFSTYVGNKDVSSPYSTGVTGLSISGGQLYAAYPVIIARGLFGLNYYPTTSLQSTAVQAFDANTGAAPTSALELPALAPGGFAISDTNLVIASNRSQISLPVPSTIKPLGPLDAPASLQSDITFGKFNLAGTPDHDIDADHGYLYFEVYPGATPQQTLNITSSAGSVPFQLFAPSGAASAVSSRGGLTPATVSVTPFPSNAASLGTVPALLLVSPRASLSIQILPVLTDNIPVRVSVQADAIVLPPYGGPATGTIRISANAVSATTLASIPVSVPFQFGANTVPPDLMLDTLSGTTPATINVTGQLDSLPPGRASVEQLSLTAGGQSQSVLVVLSRPGPPPLVSPTSLQLGGPLRQGSATGRLQVSPPDNATAFQVLSVPAGISVSPPAGTGPALLTVTADLTQFPVGTTPVTFSVQVGSTQVSITASVMVSQYPLSVGQGPLDVAPGLRLKLNVYGVPVNLPTNGAWADVSPAPTNWNGYTFVYRAHTLPILSADPSLLQFDVQLPYDLDLTANHAPIIFLAPDGTEISRGITYGAEIPSAIALFTTGNGRASVLKQDGSVVSSTNTVSPGDTIRLFVVGTGVTNPPIQPGLLPDPASTVAPVAQVQVQIGGKPATVLRQALDPSLIGVTDLDVQVPKLASGLEFLGLQTGPERVDLIQIWVASSVTVPVGLPVITGVSNAAGGQPGVFPGSFISIYGANLTPVSDDWSNSIANGQLPTQLGGVSVTIGGKPAYIAQMIPTQINAQAPDIGVGPMQVIVTTPSGSSSAYTVNSQQYGPAFWPWPGSQPVATHADYTLAAKNGTFPGTTTVPAKPGEVITLWGTGFGPVVPPVPAGQVPGQYAGAMTTNLVTVSLNGTSIAVLGAALSTYPGDYQVAIQIPASIASGDYTLAATIGRVSTPTMLFTVQQ